LEKNHQIIYFSLDVEEQAFLFMFEKCDLYFERKPTPNIGSKIISGLIRSQEEFTQDVLKAKSNHS